MADAIQEGADQILMLAADVLLEGALQPVLDVAHLQHPAGVPADGQTPQRGPQHKVVPSELTRGAEVKQSPETRVQEDLPQLKTGKRQAPAAVFVQEGEEVEQTLAVELSEMHAEWSPRRSQGASSPGQACWQAATMNPQPVLCGLDT